MGDNQITTALDFVRLGDLERASEAVQPLLPIIGEDGASSASWEVRCVWADILRLRGSAEEALNFLSSSGTSFPPATDDIQSNVRLKKGSGYCLGLLGQYGPAQALLCEAEAIASEAGLIELICEVYQCQAMISFLRQDYAASDHVFRKLLILSERSCGWYFKANALWGIGKNLMIQEHFQNAVPWLQQALALFESAGARCSMAIAWSELAVCHLGLGDDQKSLELLEHALEISSKAGIIQNYQVALANIGNVYLYRGDQLRAIDYYREALGLARKIKDPVSIQKWSHNIRSAYLRLRESVDRLDGIAV